MVYAEFGGQTECIMGNWKIENWKVTYAHRTNDVFYFNIWPRAQFKHFCK